MKSNGKPLNGPSFYYFQTAKQASKPILNESVSHMLTPTGEMSKKDQSTYRDTSYVAFYKRLLQVPPGETEFTFEIESSGVVGRGNLKINCENFMVSPYVKQLNDFEEGLIAGSNFPKQNFQTNLLPNIKKVFESETDGAYKIKLIRVLTNKEETLGTKVNGTFTDIRGKGYLIAIGVEDSEGKCFVKYGAYQNPFNGRTYDTKFVTDIQKSERIVCANIK